MSGVGCMENGIKNIGRYRIERMLGQGAMGVVYLAHDEMIERLVGIKCIRLDKVEDDTERQRAEELFFEEAKIIGKLTHPHITSIYDIGTHAGAPYIVMEYVKGKTIGEIIKSGGTANIPQILRVLAMVARALHYAHKRNIIHRDIKPANIMVMASSAPKVMDFGIARLIDATGEGSDNDPDKGFIRGTPHYMSPEQLTSKDLDQRSDIFSLGVVAYEWIAGQKPFTGKNLKELLRNIVKAEPESLSYLPDSDETLDSIIRRALVKDRRERYGNAEEFADAIDLYLARLEGREPDKEKFTTKRGFTNAQLRVVDGLRMNYSFFQDFSDEEMFSIFRMSNKETYKSGEMVFEEGTSGAKMYVILSGTCSLQKNIYGEPHTIRTLGPGECFGEMTLIDKMPRSASVIVTEDCQLVAINDVVLRASDPQLALKLYRNLASMISEKLRKLDKKYMDLVSATGEMP